KVAPALPAWFAGLFCAMPELAEVEFFRRCWDIGIGHRVLEISLHPRKHVFRGTDTVRLRQNLTGKRLLRSEARGKRMLFCFSGDRFGKFPPGIFRRFSKAPLKSPNQSCSADAIRLFRNWQLDGRRNSLAREGRAGENHRVFEFKRTRGRFSSDTTHCPRIAS